MLRAAVKLATSPPLWPPTPSATMASPSSVSQATVSSLFRRRRPTWLIPAICCKRLWFIVVVGIGVVLCRLAAREALEVGLDDSRLPRLLAGDELGVEKLAQRGVEALHALQAARLDRAGELVGLAFANHVADGRGVDQRLDRGEAALPVGASHQLLRNDAEQRSGQHRAHPRLI